MHRQVVQVALLPDYSADVRKLAEAAAKAHGGLIYMCNPNNPTASITPKAEVSWLVPNLPPDTVLLVDEAYIHSASRRIWRPRCPTCGRLRTWWWPARSRRSMGWRACAPDLCAPRRS